MDIEKKVQILRACSNKKGNRCSSCPAFGKGNRNCLQNTMRDAATALSTLQAENEKLQAELYNLRPGFQNQKALIKQLRTELEQVREKNAGLALALLTECAPNPDCLGDDEWRAIRAEIEQVKAERDAAFEKIREWEKFDTYLLIHNLMPPEKWCDQKED